MKNKQPKKAALYCRLSVDDGRMGESVSIGSQKLLLEQYCKDHAIDNYEVYDDDGYSGTNFDRPAFQRMYEDIQNGLIDTVLVKDQSRFGRSYIEVGMYVEKTHKDADHQPLIVEILIFFHFLDNDDSTISRSYNDFIGIFAGEITNRASEEIDDYCIDDSSECNESFK